MFDNSLAIFSQLTHVYKACHIRQSYLEEIEYYYILSDHSFLTSLKWCQPLSLQNSVEVIESSVLINIIVKTVVLLRCYVLQ